MVGAVPAYDFFRMGLFVSVTKPSMSGKQRRRLSQRDVQQRGVYHRILGIMGRFMVKVVMDTHRRLGITKWSLLKVDTVEFAEDACVHNAQ